MQVIVSRDRECVYVFVHTHVIVCMNWNVCMHGHTLIHAQALIAEIPKAKLLITKAKPMTALM